MVLLFPCVNDQERNFLVTIDNAAYSIVGARLSGKARHHRRAKSPLNIKYQATAHASK